MKKRQTILNAVFILLLLALLLTPLALTDTRAGVVSEIDNRKLLDAPLFGEAGFPADFEAYLGDRIGLRSVMVNAYNLLNDAAAGELTHPLYTYGRDGYVFFKMHDNIPYGSFHRTFAEMVRKMQEYCETRGCRFYFMFEPEKTSVLRRYAPAGVNYDDSWVDEMTAYMEELGVQCINNRELLTELSYREPVFNRQYDAGHWNDLGCFYATNHLLRRIGEDFPSVTELTPEEFEIGEVLQRTLPVSEFVVNEAVPSFTWTGSFTDWSSAFYKDLDLDYRYGHIHCYENDTAGAEKLPKILMFQGSYYNSRPQFLLPRTSEYVGVHNYQNVLNLDYYFNIFQPEAVVFEVTEYTFLDLYFDLEGMASVDWNPALTDARAALEAAEPFTIDEPLALAEGDGLDRVFLGRRFSDARYIYLIAGDRVYDLQEDGAGLWETGLPHGAVSPGEEAALLVEDYDGKRLRCPVWVREAADLTDLDVGSSNVTLDPASGGYQLTTDIPRNRFSSVVLQLLRTDPFEYLTALDATNHTGGVHGLYLHEEDTGWYCFCLKGNTNLQDEVVNCWLYLEQGTVYAYSFRVDELDPRHVTLSGFTVLAARS